MSESEDDMCIVKDENEEKMDHNQSNASYRLNS